MLTLPQPSMPVATPVALVEVSAGHSSDRFAGALMLGGVVSRTVIVWTALTLLPHWSEAVQVRATTRVPPQLAVTTSLNVTVVELHPSWAVATPVKFVPVLVAGHSRTTLLGT